MHLQLRRCTHSLIIVSLLGLLASCASAPTHRPAEVETRDIVQDEPFAAPLPPGGFDGFNNGPLVAEDMDSERHNSRARFFEQQAQQSSNDTRTDATLSAAEYYIQARDFEQAQTTLDALYGTSLDTVQSHRKNVVLAYITYASGDYQNTLQLLAPVISYLPPVEPVVSDPLQPEQVVIPTRPRLSTQQVDALLLSSLAYQALGNYEPAIHALIEREGALVGAARSETTRYLWQVINQIPVETRRQMIAATQRPLVRNRLEQSLSTELSSTTLEPQQFNRWREETVSEKQAISSNWNVSSPRRLAVLLPISSRFNKAAQAVKDGIQFQHDANNSPYRPQLVFYDIGDNPYQAVQYYSAATQSGADFIVGPLGREYADQVSAVANGSVATLLLGGEAALTSGVARFAMGPEQEGKQIAERAWSDGHLSAAIIAPDDAVSQRTVSAFERRWSTLGGKITSSTRYSPKQFDHSVELKQLFAIDQSNYRYNRLRQVLGYRPEFSPYQREDIDFIFMLADDDTGRLLRPQINFFTGTRLPVYATSSVFNGIQDSVNNMDLDNTLFPVMPWVLKSAQVSPYAGQLNMLFAMGSDAYEIAGNFRALTGPGQLAINGNTGQVSINRFGEAVYTPVWAKFEQGEAIPETTLGLDLSPIESDNSNHTLNSNVKGVYNDSNWNPSDGKPRGRPGN